MSASTLKPLGGLILLMDSLASRIREVMGDMARSDFAVACGVTPAAVTLWLKGDTRALKAEPVANMEARFGYRASWIVTGKGPKKVGDAAPAGQWPFSEELRRKVLALKVDDVTHIENVVRAVLHFGVNVGELPGNLDLIHGQRSASTYPAATEEGAPIEGELQDSRAPRKHASQRNRGPARKEGRGRS